MLVSIEPAGNVTKESNVFSIVNLFYIWACL